MKLDLETYAKVKVDLHQGEMIKFLDSGTVKGNKYGGKNYDFLVELPDGREKLVSLNKTSMKLLGTEWGMETDNWVGKRGVVVEGYTTSGKDMLIIKPEVV